jgi:hypothetical protein
MPPAETSRSNVKFENSIWIIWLLVVLRLRHLPGLRGHRDANAGIGQLDNSAPSYDEEIMIKLIMI